MKYIVILVLSLIWSAPAFAQHTHSSKGPNGGQMEDVAGVHAELMTSGNSITFNILDEGGKPIATNGFTGSVLVVSGSERETINLSPSGDAMKGEAKKPLAPNAAITLMLKTQQGKTGQAKFKK
jgi:hypothetical protein